MKLLFAFSEPRRTHMPVPTKILNGQPVAGALEPNANNLNVRGNPVDPGVQRAALIDAITCIHNTSTQDHASFMGVSLDSAEKMLETLDKLFDDYYEIHFAALECDHELSAAQLMECVAQCWSINRMHNEARCAILAKIQELTPQEEVEAQSRGVETSAEYPPTCGISNEQHPNVQEILRPLFALPVLEHPTQAGLYGLVDTMEEAMRQLTVSGISVEQVLVQMLLERLDPQTAIAWEMHRSNAVLPTLGKLCAFVDERAALAHTQSEQEKTRVKRKAKARIPCPCCKSTHPLHRCPSFQAMSRSKRKRSVYKWKMCKNCLRSWHGRYMCAAGPCKRCPGNVKHNSLICPARKASKEAQPLAAQSAPRKIPEKAIDLVHDFKLIGEQPFQYVGHERLNGTIDLRPTALVHVQIEPFRFACRALCDTGSQVNTMRKSCAKRLGVKTTPCNRVIFGAGNHETVVHELALLDIYAWHNDRHLLTEEFLIIDEKSRNSPYTKLTEMELPDGVVLADPGYNIPLKNDLLIGASALAKIMGAKTFRNSVGIVLQETELGHTVMGRFKVPQGTAKMPATVRGTGQ